MANQINITPASQVATVEVNNRQLSVNVQDAVKTVEITVAPRGNVNVEVSRSVSPPSVEQIVAGTNITISPSEGKGIVTISASDNPNNANYANYANFSGTTFSVSGSNVNGSVNNANIANRANVAYSVAGSNVVGSVSVANTANSVPGGGVQGYVSSAYYAQRASFADQANLVYGGNVSGAVQQANVANISNVANVAYSVSGSNVVGAINLATYATIANSVAGANVSGQVSYAAVADSVDVANVVGIGTIAVINLNNQSTTVLYGDGEWRTAGTVANAVYAEFAGEAYLVSGSNVDGAVSLATYATIANSVAGANIVGAVELANIANIAYEVAGGNVLGPVTEATNANHANVSDLANSVAGANVTGSVAFADEATIASTAVVANSVAVANVVGIGNIATINLNNESTEALFGDGVWRTIATGIPNYANFAGEAFNVSGSNVVGEVANAGYATISGISYSVSGANVSGQVANSLIADTVYNNAQPNITSVGYLEDLRVVGDFAPGSNAMYNLGTPSLRFKDLILSGNIDFGNSNINQSGTSLNVNGVMIQPGTIDGGYISGIVPYAIGASDAYHATISDAANVAYSVDAGNIVGTINLANYATVANSVAIANVSGIGNIATINLDGNVANILRGDGTWAPESASLNANYANFAGQIIDATQSNITSVGSLTSLTVIGDVTATSIVGPVGGGANIDIAPDGIGHVNLNADTIRIGDNNVDATIWTRGAGNLTIKTHDVQANESNITIVNGATGNIQLNPKGIVVTSSNVQANYFIGNGSSLTNITGANVTGTVANATYAISAGSATVADSANSVAVANVVGIGNIATTNYNGNGSQILAGNGAWISTPNTASANYANFAGEAFNVSGSNVTGAVSLATYATTANSVAGANVSGTVANATYAISAGSANSVAVANVVGIGNIAVLNLTGSSTNVLYGNGIFAPAGGGGGGTPGGANTQLQFNNDGAFGGISTVTWNGSNISLGAVGNVKITGGSNNYILATDGTGNLSFSAKTNNLTIGTRTVSVNIPITDYTMNVQGRTGNISVNVN